MTFIDWFAGVGGFRRGMELAGHKCVGFCEFDKFAVASYTSMHLITEDQRKYLATLPFKQRQKEILKDEYRNGEWYANDITRVCAADIPRADCWCAGFPCFTKGTLITTHRGQVPIEQIKSGDLVLTHKNRFKRVIKPMINVKRGIYTLKVQGSPITEVTGNHRFYVRDKSRRWNNDKRQYEIIISDPYWKEVQDFTGNELVQFPNNQNSENIYGLSELECWLIGRYIADGYMRDGIRKDRPSHNQKIIICVGKAKAREFEESIGNIKFCKSEERTVLKYVLHDKKLFSLCLQCGRGAENKCIPQFIMDLPANLIVQFLNGYLSGDGSEKDGEYKATSVSRTLIYQLGQCIEKAYGVGYSIHYTKRPETCVIEGRTVNQKDTWQIRFKAATSSKRLSFYLNDSLWMPIKEINFNSKRVETVYNMEVEDDNSYTANNMGVHNCQDISIAGKQEGFQGNRSSLFFRLMYLIGQLREEDRPSFIFLENVKNLLSVNGGWDFARLLVEMDKGGYDAGWQVLNSKDYGVPQNRERVFIIGYLRGRCPGEVFLVEGTGGQNSIHLIGHKNGYRRNTQVFSSDGITEALDTAAGGGRGHHVGIKINLPAFCDMDKGAGLKLADTARTLQARYNKGINNHKGEISGVAIPVLTPDRTEKCQNGRRFKENGEPMFTLTAQDIHGVAFKVKEATKQDYSEAYEGDSINLSMPESKTRRGRVGHQIAQTLDTSCNQGTPIILTSDAPDLTDKNNGIHVETPEGFSVYAIWYEKEQCYIAIRKLTPKETFRLQGFSDELFEKAAFVNSDSQLYRQAGNGVSVPVIKAIGERFKDVT